MMYQLEDCLIHASLCREKARAYPERSDFWTDRAIVWHRRAIQARRKAVTYEVHDGRMIATSAK